GKEVTAVAADARQPRLDQWLGGGDGPGLPEVLSGSTPLEKALRRTKVPGLTLLSSGMVESTSAGEQNGAALPETIAKLKSKAPIVVIDVPDLSAATTLELIRAVDGVILVVDHRRTTRRQLERVDARLARLGVPLVGVVVNFFKPKGLGSLTY